MQKFKQETRTVNVLDSIVCNRCEASLHNGMNFEGLLNAMVEGGYGAKLGDCIRYEFDLCETCLEELFKTFKIPALVQPEEPQP